MGVQFTVTLDNLSCRFSPKFACFCACVGVEPRWNALEQAVLGALCRAGRQSHLGAGAPTILTTTFPKSTIMPCHRNLPYRYVIRFYPTNDETLIQFISSIETFSSAVHNMQLTPYDLRTWMCARPITPRKGVTPRKLLIFLTYT